MNEPLDEKLVKAPKKDDRLFVKMHKCHSPETTSKAQVYVK